MNAFDKRDEKTSVIRTGGPEIPDRSGGERGLRRGPTPEPPSPAPGGGFGPKRSLERYARVRRAPYACAHTLHLVRDGIVSRSPVVRRANAGRDGRSFRKILTVGHGCGGCGDGRLSDGDVSVPDVGVGCGRTAVRSVRVTAAGPETARGHRPTAGPDDALDDYDCERE